MRLVREDFSYFQEVEIPTTKVWESSESLDIFIQPKTVWTSSTPRPFNIKIFSYPTRNLILTYTFQQGNFLFYSPYLLT